MPTTVGELAALVGGVTHGDPSHLIDDLADLQSAGPRAISFLANPRYIAAFRASRAGAVLVQERIDNAPCTQVVCANPYLAMAQIATALHPPPASPPGIEAGAQVHPTATIHPTATVRMGAVVDAEASIGPGATIGATCYIGQGVRVGANCLLHPGVRVLHRCSVGERVILHSGVVVGSDGFGFAPDAQGRRHKIPQVGVVVIEDDVEVGANSTIDRATFGITRIGAGSKIDNLVQIAHNVVLGKDCVVVSQTGIAGSTILGDRVVIGAQGGIVGHIAIADDVMLGARSGVASSIDKAGVYSGAPAMPHRQWLKMAMVQQSLPELRRRVRELETQLDQRNA